MEKFIFENSLGMILVDFIKNINKLSYFKALKLINNQKIINELLLSEYKNLNKIAKENDIKLVFLKGLVEAYDLYHKPEVRRVSDIDVLIDIEDLEKFILILSRNNYKYVDNKQTINTDYLKEKNIDILSMKGNAHIPAIYKEIVDEHLHKYNIQIDVHVRLSHSYEDEKKYIKEVLNRAGNFNLEGEELKILEIHDRMLHLLYHFVKEFAVVALDQMLHDGKVPKLRLWLLHDVALLIEKYNYKIDWEEIIKRAKDWGVIGEVLFSLKLIDSIYPNRVPENVVNKLERIYESIEIKEGSGIRKLIFKELTKYEPATLIFSNLFDIVSLIISKLRKGSTLECNYGIDSETEFVKLSNYRIHFNEKDEDNFKIEKVPSDFYAMVGANWDDKNLILKINVYDEFIKFNNSRKISNIFIAIGECCVKSKDGEEKPYIRRITFEPVNSNGKIKILMWNTINWKVEFYDESNYDLKCFKDGYLLEIKIPWSFLKIEAKPEKSILFRIEVQRYKEGLSIIEKLSSIGYYDPIREPTYMNELKLSKW
ncbi:nucleotidyltransferase family protein [Caldicellulosiruptoraceae bacterium PP1]